jgi:hypothetical protein
VSLRDESIAGVSFTILNKDQIVYGFWDHVCSLVGWSDVSVEYAAASFTL